jgi:hypothetical protein
MGINEHQCKPMRLQLAVYFFFGELGDPSGPLAWFEPLRHPWVLIRDHNRKPMESNEHQLKTIVNQCQPLKTQCESM